MREGRERRERRERGEREEREREERERRERELDEEWSRTISKQSGYYDSLVINVIHVPETHSRDVTSSGEGCPRTGRKLCVYINSLLTRALHMIRSVSRIAIGLAEEWRKTRRKPCGYIDFLLISVRRPPNVVLSCKGLSRTRWTICGSYDSLLGVPKTFSIKIPCHTMGKISELSVHAPKVLTPPTWFNPGFLQPICHPRRL